MSLTGALLAVFIQQWALSYLHATQERHSPSKRARIRAYHAEGLEKLYLHRVTRAVPILIHLSLFLFFSGLPVFLFNINRTVFNVVITWLALCVAGYACITLMPIFCHDSPYYSPLSSLIWWCVINTLFIIYRLLSKFMRRDSFVLRWYHTHYAESHLRWPSLRSMQEAGARFALNLTSKIDYRALLWMFKTLNNDKEFEQFFDALPGLQDSALGDLQGAFIEPNKEILSHALVGMMDRTLLSDLVPEEVKQRRIIICIKAIDATSLLGSSGTLHRVLFGDWHGFSQSVHFGLFVQDWKSISNPVMEFYAQYVVAVTLARVQIRDDNWYQLASGQLNESKSLLQNYYAYGDSILLANAIFIVRRTIQTYSGSKDHDRKDIAKASKKTLELICRFDIQKTLSEHQRLFCGLWNQLVHAAQNNTNRRVTSLCKMMLKNTRRIYIALHVGTPCFPKAFSRSTDDEDRVLEDARSFPKCEMREHEHSLPVPELQLGELPRNSRPNPDSSIAMIPAMSRPLIPAPPPIPTQPPQGRSHYFDGSPYYPALGPPYPVSPGPPYPVASNPPYPVAPGPPYPVAPGPSPVAPSPPYRVAPGPPYTASGPYPHPAPPTLPGFSPFVPISQMTSSPRGVPVTLAGTVSEQDVYIPPSASALTSRSSSPASHVHRVPEPAPPARGQLDAISPAIHVPVSTRAPPITTSYIDASHDISGPTTTNRLERPSSPPTVIIPETVPALPLPTPASAADSGTAAPVLPVVLWTPQERMSTPPSPPSVPQESPVHHQVTNIPVKASRDTSPTHHVVSFNIPSPSTPSVAPVALSMPVTTAPIASSSMTVRTPTDTTDTKRGGIISSAIERESHAGSTPLATLPVIKFDGYGDFSGLLYHSQHTVVYEDELYPTALHLFEARKFLPHRPDLADRIRQCEHVEEVASISAELAKFMRVDWAMVALSTVSKLCHIMHPF